jgi:hypothetical protein
MRKNKIFLVGCSLVVGRLLMRPTLAVAAGCSLLLTCSLLVALRLTTWPTPTGESHITWCIMQPPATSHHVYVVWCPDTRTRVLPAPAAWPGLRRGLVYTYLGGHVVMAHARADGLRESAVTSQAGLRVAVRARPINFCGEKKRRRVRGSVCS